MATSIERMLELNTKIEKGQVSHSQENSGYRVANKNDLDRLIENFDQQVYGQSVEPVMMEEKPHKYSAREEMERLKAVESNGGRGSVNLEGRNIPKEIVESIINNPLDMPPIVDDKMTALTERIANKGIKAAVDVMNKVEKSDAKTQLNERVMVQNPNQDIVNIIEECIDRKINEIQQSITENIKNQTYVPSMKYLSFKDNFYFVDNDDNVFECVMKYKGKRKKRK